MKRKSLVILSSGFGTNISGGTSATHHTFNLLRDRFEEVIFIGKALGDHQYEGLNFKKYKTPLEALSILNELKKRSDLIYFGDFYMTYFFILAGLPYYFAYHDNWPEQSKNSLSDWLKGLFYIPIYNWIIRKAKWTFTVSNFKMNYVRRLTNRSSLVRNGTILPINPERGQNPEKAIRILMIGNIDERKYDEAVPVFERIRKKDVTIVVDIFGNEGSDRMTNALKAFEFVNLKGFSSEIPFADYDLLLSTSRMENLAISVVEALKSHLPVIAYDVGGLNEVIDNHNGRLIPLGDNETLFNEIKKIRQSSFIFRDDDLKEFDWEVTAEKYGEIIFGSHE